MRMQDVAKRLGISAMTVSRALRADTTVAPATREAVLKAIEELGYVPNQIAGSLASRRSGFAAVLVPSLNNSHFSETVLALNAALEPHHIQLLIGSTDYDREKEAGLVRAFLARKPEAIVLTNDGHSPDVVRLLGQARVPVVQIWDLPARPIQHVVGFSNREAMKGLIATLLRAGYRRITYFGELDDDETRGAARRHGYCEAMREVGLSPRLCAIARPPATMSDGERALDEVLQHYPDTELVACVSDPLAFGIMAACARRGISVPDQLAISGFGDFEIARVSAPGITTVRIDAASIGRLTGEIVLDLLVPAAPAQQGVAICETVPAEPVLRGSAPGTVSVG
ncbi:LacI family DNA-binding transcriptional regulator [Bosea sp. F3-2]|uniref:LacI family DNA-binding transcriptional regulator n=1 Tax=Bosea sp. F3-2 TaxID=2599640 RepID=UPI001655F19D|nr:LacI family DNA-binding transcriptional regulator [Bosea sp. F3-2]